jgi:uncharacterized membrane protein HdeD (DUF308 family)
MDRKGDDPADLIANLIAKVGRLWAWVLAFGIITLIVGVLVLGWPGRTVEVVAVLVGVQLIWAGIYRFVSAFAIDEARQGVRVLLALLGVLSFIVGLYALRHVLVTVQALALLLGIFWIVNGLIETFTALSHREMQGRGWTIVLGLLSIAAGVATLAYPGVSLTALAIVLGVWLVILGVMEVVLAVQLRTITQGGRARVAR